MARIKYSERELYEITQLARLKVLGEEDAKQYMTEDDLIIALMACLKYIDLGLEVDKYGEYRLRSKVGYAGKDIAVPPCFYVIRPPDQNGLLKVKAKKKYGWGFVDKTGKPIGLGCIYDYVQDFIDEYSEAKLNNKWGFIDKTGKPLGAGCVYISVRPFIDGFARVKVANMQHSFLDYNGNILTSSDNLSIYNAADDFQEGFAAVRLKRKWGFIDKNGNLLGDGCIYDSVQSFKNGKAKVSYKKTQGWLDTEGVFHCEDAKYQSPKQLGLNR